MNAPSTTGATAWDFLISLNIPIVFVIIIGTFAFCIVYAEKLLALSGAIAGLFRNISKRAKKKHISASIRSSVISASKKIGSNEAKILPADLKIKWADDDDIKSFFEDDCVVVRLRQTSDPNENYINIIYHFVSSGLLKSQKHYFNDKIMSASSLLVTQKIVSLSKPSANSLFIKSIYGPEIEADEDVKDHFQQLQRIDLNGMLFNIYLNELMKAAATVEGQIPDPCLKAESVELLRYLYNIANRAPEDSLADLSYKGAYFKVGIILAASDETLNRSGWTSYISRAKKLLDDNYDTIYVFGIGRKASTASKIAYAIKNRDNRIVKTATHQYRHVNVESGRRVLAVCVELDTY